MKNVESISPDKQPTWGVWGKWIVINQDFFFFRWGGDLDVGKFQFCLSEHNKTLLSF